MERQAIPNSEVRMMSFIARYWARAEEGEMYSVS
jgi:hypothetical protein